MSDFTSSFWSLFIIAGTVGGILFCFILLRSNMTANVDAKQGKEVKATGHVWDGDLEELNSPLPSWWLYMFYFTIIFAIGYLILYPGLGSFKGVLGWTSHGQYEKEMQQAAAKYDPLYKKYAKQDLVALAGNKEAMKTGQRLFQTYCTVCHGSDARGQQGFPNLTDNDWLWGGEPAQIKQTIANGRKGTMPSWKAMLKGPDLDNVVEYVRKISGHEADPEKAAAGEAKFKTICAACHGADGKGNVAMGAPNLTDSIWLYGGSRHTLKKTVADGRNGVMPAHKDFLGMDKVHLLAAYIYSLSHSQ